jgi:hypothetical protein
VYIRQSIVRLLSLAAITAAAGSLLQAQDFWLSKPPEQWSPLEIKRLVTGSPWAKRASVRPRAAEASTTEWARGNKVPAPEIVVRWESASLVSEACAKGGMERHLFSCVSKLLYLSGLVDKFENLRTHFYIVGLSNYPKPPRQPGVSEHSAAGNAALEKLSRGIQESTFLRFKDRGPSQPLNVVSLPAGQSLLVIVFFPRTDAISLTDHEVFFESVVGTMELRATFLLREMLYRGKLDL